MGNKPSEYDGATCQCGKDLPPCKSFKDFNKGNINRIVDCVSTFNFLGGRYYRIEGSPTYYCPECFWKPKENYLKQLEQEREASAEISKGQQDHSSAQPQPASTRGKRKREDHVNCSELARQPIRPKKMLVLRSEDISDKTLIEISKKVGSKYLDLGIHLGLDNNTVQNAIGNETPDYKKSFQVLQDWKKRAGNDFTFTVLAKALEDMGLTTDAQQFCYVEE